MNSTTSVAAFGVPREVDNEGTLPEPRPAIVRNPLRFESVNPDHPDQLRPRPFSIYAEGDGSASVMVWSGGDTADLTVAVRAGTLCVELPAQKARDLAAQLISAADLLTMTSEQYLRAYADKCAGVTTSMLFDRREPL